MCRSIHFILRIPREFTPRTRCKFHCRRTGIYPVVVGTFIPVIDWKIDTCANTCINTNDTTAPMSCIFDSLKLLFRKHETKPMPQIVRFIRKSDTGLLTFNWRMTECYICCSEFCGGLPRAFPFECDHEICRGCLVRYTKHNLSAGKPPPNCGMCEKPIRTDWGPKSVICSRELSDHEWVWIPGSSLTGRHPNERQLQLDTLQYQLAHGSSPSPTFRERAYTV